MLVAATLFACLVVIAPCLSPIAWAAIDLRRKGSYTLPRVIRALPWFGEQLQQQVNRYSAEPAALVHLVGNWVQVGR